MTGRETSLRPTLLPWFAADTALDASSMTSNLALNSRLIDARKKHNLGAS